MLTSGEIIADSEGRTPLHWAVDRGHLDITKLLISRNAEVNVKVKEMFYKAIVYKPMAFQINYYTYLPLSRY